MCRDQHQNPSRADSQTGDSEVSGLSTWKCKAKEGERASERACQAKEGERASERACQLQFGLQAVNGDTEMPPLCHAIRHP